MSLQHACLSNIHSMPPENLHLNIHVSALFWYERRDFRTRGSICSINNARGIAAPAHNLPLPVALCCATALRTAHCMLHQLPCTGDCRLIAVTRESNGVVAAGVNAEENQKQLLFLHACRRMSNTVPWRFLIRKLAHQPWALFAALSLVVRTSAVGAPGYLYLRRRFPRWKNGKGVVDRAPPAISVGSLRGRRASPHITLQAARQKHKRHGYALVTRMQTCNALRRRYAVLWL